MVKGTMMTGRATGRTIPPTTNPPITPCPTPSSRPASEKEMGPSGTETTATDGSNQHPAYPNTPCCLCCLYLLWPLSPPCGDSCLLQSGGKCLCHAGVFEAHYERKHVIPFGYTSKKKTKQDNLIMYGLAIIYKKIQFTAQKGIFFPLLNKPQKGMITNNTE